jgi:hypothetical protein
LTELSVVFPDVPARAGMVSTVDVAPKVVLVDTLV